ncbi:MAG: ParB/RepB/Spo0J family partition protein [Rectinemataceae bacterium]
MARQFGLGKGLGALIPEPDPVPLSLGSGEESHDGVLRLPLGKLRPNPDQPRKSFPAESIAELAESLKRHGLIQPIIAEDAGDGVFVIIAGERRYRAAEAAGLREVPVILRKFSPEKRLEIALIENIQREDLNPVDEAEAYRALMTIGGRSQEEVADIVGKSRSAVANSLRLLRLPQPMLDSLRDGSLSAGHARAILMVADSALRDRLFARVKAEGISVREAENSAQDLNRGNQGKQPKAKVARQREPEIRDVEERLIESLGTKVSIRGDSRKGTIAIEYYSMEDLERILDILGKDSAT